MTLKIVDVSSHQENYILGSNGEDGVLIKATQGVGYVNPNCDFVAQQAIKQNKPWGLYHYAGGNDAIAEADYFLNNISNYLKENNKPIIILDWEEYQNSAYGNGVWAEIFIQRIIEKTGITAGIYGNGTDLSQMTDWTVNNAWVWFAGYPYASGTSHMILDWNYPDFPYNKGKFKIITGWQFSSQPLDKSVFYVDINGWNKLANNTNPAPTPPTPPVKQAPKVTYGLRSLGGGWLGDITDFNNSDSNGFAGNPNHMHDMLYMKVDRGSIRYRVHTVKSGWLGWVSKGDKNDLVNGCAGNPNQAIDGVQIYYTSPAGQKYQAYYRSQTTARSGWLGVCCDDGTSIKGFYGWAGILGEALDRLQIDINTKNPY